MLHLLGVHVTGADRANVSGPVPLAPGEGQKHMTATAGAPDRQKARLHRRMRDIWPYGWRPSEHAFDFRQRDTVLLAFGLVAFVPIEASDSFAIHDEEWHLYVRLSILIALSFAAPVPFLAAIPFKIALGLVMIRPAALAAHA